jgi:hypothetical protein
MRVDAAKYGDEAALHALGAQSVAEVRDDAGALVAYDVSPEISLKGYAAAARDRFLVVKAEMKAAIDASAEALRLTLITPGAGQAMEYQEAYAQAQAALAADGPVKDADYPMLAATIGVDFDPSSKKPATDVLGVARSVKAAYEAYLLAGAAIRGVRLTGKAKIDAATDEAAARAAFKAISWPSFA